MSDMSTFLHMLTFKKLKKFLKKLKVEVSYDPPISFWLSIQKNCKQSSEKMGTPMLRAALRTTAKQ